MNEPEDSQQRDRPSIVASVIFGTLLFLVAVNWTACSGFGLYNSFLEYPPMRHDTYALEPVPIGDRLVGGLVWLTFTVGGIIVMRGSVRLLGRAYHQFRDRNRHA